MNPRAYVPIIDGIGFFIFFVLNPVIFVAIGYSAWKGRPITFDRRKYALSTIATFLPGTALILFAKWINADVRTWLYIPQVICMLLGLLLVGVGCGCGAGFVTFRQQKSARSEGA